MSRRHTSLPHRPWHAPVSRRASLVSPGLPTLLVCAVGCLPVAVHLGRGAASSATTTAAAAPATVSAAVTDPFSDPFGDRDGTGPEGDGRGRGHHH